MARLLGLNRSTTGHAIAELLDTDDAVAMIEDLDEERRTAWQDGGP